MDSETRMELIEDYTRNKLSQEARARFEQQLLEDAELREDVDAHLRANRILDFANRERLSQRLKEIDSELDGQMTTAAKKYSLIKPLAVAASIVLLIAAGLIIFTDLASPTLSVEQYALENHVSTEAEVFRDGAVVLSKFDSDMQVADQLFSNGQYGEAANLYSKLAETDHVRSDVAEWNLMLTHYAAANTEDGKRVLDNILNDPDHMYSEKATRFARSLD